METTINSNQARTFQSTETASTISTSTSTFWGNAEFNRFGIISMLVVIIACTGGLAAGFGAQADTLKLAMIAFPTMIALSLILAVAPMKAIVYVSVIAIILDLVVLIF